MINNRLRWWLEHNIKLPGSQFGFRKNRLCIDNETILFSETLKANYDRKYAIGLFIDIRGAYDNVIAKILVKILVELGLPRRMVIFLYNLESERRLWISYDVIDDIRLVCRGLYAIYMISLENQEVEDCRISQFADDTTVALKTKNLEEEIKIMEKCARKITEFLNSYGLQRVPEKCKLCTFGN